ncbi:MAG: DUF3800 domain-containing protein [Dehalococcoidia bacterium]
MFICLDESGDLGFDYSKRKTTNKFVVTLLVCNSAQARKALEKATRRTLKNKLNVGKKKSRIVTELKGTRTTLKVKEYFFRHIDSDDWGIYTLVLNKRRVNANLRTRAGRQKLYNFLSRFLIERLPLRTVTQNVELIVDSCKNRAERSDFNQYLCNQLQAMLPLNTAFHITHQQSTEAAGLQAVDLFCWGMFRKHELGDTAWYDVFSSKVKYEDVYLP